MSLTNTFNCKHEMDSGDFEHLYFLVMCSSLNLCMRENDS